MPVNLKHVLLDAAFAITPDSGSRNDLSDHVKSVSISAPVELQEITAMGDATKANAPGLEDWTIEVEFYQDFAAGEVDATMWTERRATLPPLIEVQALAASWVAAAENPIYKANARISDYQPIGGSVGEAHMAPVTFKPAESGQSLVRQVA